MKFSILAVLLLQFIWTESAFLAQSVEDYYWRDYNGLVPSDAILAGRNSKGEKLFFGQFGLHRIDASKSRMDTIPATITHGSPTAECAYAGYTRYSTDESNLKILCSASLSRYRWHSVKSQLPPNCRYVIGGYELGSPLYIGGETIKMGKVFANKFPLVLITPADNGRESTFDTFSVLTYCN